MATPLAVKERAILMSAPMVLATLEDRKGQTRRIVKGLEISGPNPPNTFDVRKKGEWVGAFGRDGKGNATSLCPYGKPGDRLWVRETWRTRKCFDNLSPNDIGKRVGKDVFYEADSAVLNISGVREEFTPGRIRSSIHLPRWGSRIALEITGVRVERLLEISNVDCWAEGIRYTPEPPVPLYQQLWESINGDGSWALNPWVWVISFKRLSQ